MYVLLIVVCPFVLFLLAIVLSVLLRNTDSDYPFGVFNLFRGKTNTTKNQRGITNTTNNQGWITNPTNNQGWITNPTNNQGWTTNTTNNQGGNTTTSLLVGFVIHPWLLVGFVIHPWLLVGFVIHPLLLVGFVIIPNGWRLHNKICVMHIALQINSIEIEVEHNSCDFVAMVTTYIFFNSWRRCFFSI
jgi:hypothetical protein